MAPALLLMLKGLLKGGLSLTANAVLAKGKEWVEEKAGVKLAPEMSPDDLLKVKQWELDNEAELQRLRVEENKLDVALAGVLAGVDKVEQEALTERHRNDMASDSWLSKNIRPLALIAIFVSYLIFAGLSAAQINISESYVKLLGEWGMLVMSFYFGGRSAEKIAEIVTRYRKNRDEQEKGQ